MTDQLWLIETLANILQSIIDEAIGYWKTQRRVISWTLTVTVTDIISIAPHTRFDLPHCSWSLMKWIMDHAMPTLPRQSSESHCRQMPSHRLMRLHRADADTVDWLKTMMIKPLKESIQTASKLGSCSCCVKVF